MSYISRPSDGVIRDDFRDRPVRDWSRAELDTAWNETEAKMIAAGFGQLPAEDARIWHARYARACLTDKGFGLKGAA